MRDLSIFIPNRSGPGITTTLISHLSPRVTGGNATWVQRRATTTAICAAGLTEEFEVGVGLHKGSALSPFLFDIIMGKLTQDIRKDAPWDMMFADEIVLSRQSHIELEEDLEIWRNALERKGLKVNRSWTDRQNSLLCR